jgi:hypothetical protein
MIEEKGLDKEKKHTSLEAAIMCLTGTKGCMTSTDTQILSDFRKHHLDHLNLSVHGHKRPDYLRLNSALAAIEDFVRRHA